MNGLFWVVSEVFSHEDTVQIDGHAPNEVVWGVDISIKNLELELLIIVWRTEYTEHNRWFLELLFVECRERGRGVVPDGIQIVEDDRSCTFDVWSNDFNIARNK